jgi:hypothetical protein
MPSPSSSSSHLTGEPQVVASPRPGRGGSIAGQGPSAPAIGLQIAGRDSVSSRPRALFQFRLEEEAAFVAPADCGGVGTGVRFRGGECQGEREGKEDGKYQRFSRIS